MTTPSERTPSSDSPEETAETTEAAVPAPGKADATHRRAVTAGTAPAIDRSRRKQAQEAGSSGASVTSAGSTAPAASASSG